MFRTRVGRATSHAIALTVAIASCADEADQPELADDIPATVFSNEDLTSVPKFDAFEELRIGGDSELTRFSYLSGIGVDSHGRVYAVDQHANEVTVFDAAGQPIRRFGGRGRGPGELQRPMVAVLANDTLFVIDLQGITRFTADGSFLGRISIKTPTFLLNEGSGTIRFPQYLAHTVHGLVAGFPVLRYGHRREISRDTVSFHLLDPATGVSTSPGVVAGSATIYRTRSGLQSPAMFINRPQVSIAPDGTIYITNPDQTSIDVRPLTGAAKSRLRFDARRRPVRRVDVQAYMTRMARAVRENPVGRDHEAQQRLLHEIENLPRAEFWPVVGRVVAMANDGLLVERTDLGVSSIYPLDPVVWDIVDRRPSVVGRLVLPRQFEPKQATAQTITGVMRDSLDVPSIVRYRLRNPLKQLDSPLPVGAPTGRSDGA